MFLLSTALALPEISSTEEATGGLLGPDRETPTPYIVAGTETDAHENVVALSRPNGDGYDVFCSGTLVHPRFVVTAAHCLFGQGEGWVVLFGGDLRAGSPNQTREVVSHRAHPDYDAAEYLNDIGVLELDSAVTDVRLAAVNAEAPDNGWLGDPLRFVGFGDPFDGAQETGIKRYADIPMLDWDTQYVYAGNADGNVCQGDSGGASFTIRPDGHELVGVNAFTLGGCAGGDNGASRVDRFLPWLETHIPHLYTDASDVPPVESDTDTDADTDADVEPEVDLDDTGWGAPVTPTEGSYRRCACGTAPGSSWMLLVFSAGCAGLRRRRKPDWTPNPRECDHRM